eukprot:COSAG06_NODE_68151_length_238_cov_4.402878_1_plen_78_part_11
MKAGGKVTLGNSKKFTVSGAQVSHADIIDFDFVDRDLSAAAGADIEIVLRAGGPATASGDITAGTTLTFSTDDPDAAN